MPFRADRLKELLVTPRCEGGLPQTNFVGGLLDLISTAKPVSVLEIGSDSGVSTECFLLHCDRVVAVDSWEGQWAPHYQNFLERCGSYPNLEIVRERSPDALNCFSDNEFDLVYVDADHEYDPAYRDIAAAMRVAKHWMAGHDFIASGVERAVRELLGNPLVFSDTSWLIRSP